jgi:iron(III) transport system ATP-binding protein
MTSVAVSGLCKSFGPRSVLDGLELEVPDGSLTAVLGPSGSGKTTLLRILAGFERADRGRVVLGGAAVDDERTHVAPEDRRVGYVPQDGALFPHLDAARNIGFGLSRRQRRSGRVEELLALVGLSGEGHRYPHQLSGGQQQRVALARALAAAPGLILLDEPFSSLDAALRAGVRADVARVLRETGATAVLVTHDQDEALSLADQVAVLRNGRVAQCGPPDEIYNSPVDPAMARFVGDANVLEGTVRAGTALTSLGPLELLDGGRAFHDAQRVLVLVRPEQVEVRTGTGGGRAGRVAESHYYGHDTMAAIQPEGAAGEVVLARLPGGPPLAEGTRVSMRAVGPVAAWPADGNAPLRASGDGPVGKARNPDGETGALGIVG